MLRARISRAAGRVQREAQEREPTHTGKGSDRLRLRAHASAEGAATGKQRQRRSQTGCLGDRCAHGRMTQRRRIGAARTALHVGKLEAQRCDTEPAQVARGRGHERVVHACAGAMRHDVAGARACG